MEKREDLIQLADERIEEAKRLFGENRMHEARLLMLKSFRFLKENEEYERYARALNILGVIAASSGDEAGALDYYLEGLEYSLEYHYDNITCLLYNNIGARYQALSRHKKALSYFTKAAMLESPVCQCREEYESWCLVTYLNLQVSYRETNQFSLAKKYLKKAEKLMHGNNQEQYKYTFLIAKCKLAWKMGEHDFVYRHMDELMQAGMMDRNASDYQQDMRDLSTFLREMKEYDKYKKILEDYSAYADELGSEYFSLMRQGMWMGYYITMKDRENYERTCVDIVERLLKLRELAENDRSEALDRKVELWEAERERKHMEEKSTTDALTGLGNRYRMEEDMDSIVRMAVKNKSRITVGVVDVDYFKKYNDTYGHIYGDICLKMVADVLKKTIGDEGAVYRFGGDEYVILLHMGDAEEVEKIASIIKEELLKMKVEESCFHTSMSITVSQGYACFVPTGEEHGDNLIEHADTALYYVKNHGRNGYHVIQE